MLAPFFLILFFPSEEVISIQDTLPSVTTSPLSTLPPAHSILHPTVCTSTLLHSSFVSSFPSSTPLSFFFLSKTHQFFHVLVFRLLHHHLFHLFVSLLTFISTSLLSHLLICLFYSYDFFLSILI